MEQVLASDLTPLQKLGRYLELSTRNIESNRAKMKVIANEHRSLEGDGLIAFRRKNATVGGILSDLLQEVGLRVGSERLAAHQEFVEDHPQAEYV